MSDNNEAVAAAPAEIPMVQPVAEQVPEESHAARARKPRGRKSAEPEQTSQAVDRAVSKAVEAVNGKGDPTEASDHSRG